MTYFICTWDKHYTLIGSFCTHYYIHVPGKQSYLPTTLDEKLVILGIHLNFLLHYIILDVSKSGREGEKERHRKTSDTAI